MSERAPSASTTAEIAAPSPEGVGQVEADAQSIEDAFSTTPEQTDLGESASKLESALNPDTPAAEKDILKLSPEEQKTKTKFEKLKELQISVQKGVVPRINSLEPKINTARGERDKFTKKALMLERREGSKQKKSARLEEKLELATPGSRRHRRLMYKYGKTNRKLGELQSHIGRLDGAADTRTREHERKKLLREKQISLRRDMLKIDKKVALAKKERRRLTKEMKSASSESQRAKLGEELSRNNISRLRQNLLDEAMRHYKKIDDVKKDDYELAA